MPSTRIPNVLTMPRPALIFDLQEKSGAMLRFLAACLTVGFCGAVFAADGMPAMKKAARAELGSSAAFSPSGKLYAVSKQGEHLMLYRSDDEGQTWSPPVVVNARPEAISADGENRPKLAFAKDGGLLVSWTQPLSRPFSGAIRLARSDDGIRFSEPLTVHGDRSEITHRFESMVVAGDGRVVLAWIDKRDLEDAKNENKPYRGAAIYSASSVDGGRSFQAEQKIADYSCECCRIAAAVDETGAPVFMWRHVFAPNERDHALVRINASGAGGRFWRATQDRWRIDGCPHHGPSLAISADNVFHAVWFNQVGGEGRVFYGRLPRKEGEAISGQRAIGGPTAAHADLSVSGTRVAIAWKEFDGQKTVLRAEVSDDAGLSFRPLNVAESAGATDQPRVLSRGDVPYVFWRTEREGMRVYRLQ